MTAIQDKQLFDLTLSEDQLMTRDTMQRFARNEMREVAQSADDARLPPAGFYDKTAELGLALLPIPEALGVISQ
jgi:alkylation response protein AidB-like acyl-CoA dehydrogenase